MSKGKDLAQALKLECSQALYSAWGNFYAPITSYPCVLFDECGFIIINSPAELGALGIKIGKRTNVPNKISSLPSYIYITAYRAQSADEICEEVVKQYAEGALQSVIVNRYERDRRARNACLAFYGFACHACGIELEKIYGAVAQKFIHVHHIKPIATIGEQYQVDPINDLRPLCPNCHAIVHLRKEPYTIEEIKYLLAAQKNLR